MKPFGSFVLPVLVSAVPLESAPKDADNVQEKPIETTICKITENPSAFNNKLVKVRGHVEVSFEYSILEDDSCTDGLWFALADGSGPSGLVITVNGSGKPGGKKSRGNGRQSSPSL